MRVNGFRLVCPHCKGREFLHKLVPIESDSIPIPPALRKGETADAFTCKKCHRTEWFVDAVVDFEESKMHRSAKPKETKEDACPRCGSHFSKAVTVCPACGKRLRSPRHKSSHGIF